MRIPATGAMHGGARGGRARDVSLSGLFLGLVLAVPMTARAQDANASPHWSRGACQVCHTRAQPNVADAGLKSAAGALCTGCHGDGDAAACPHRSDLATGEQAPAQVDDALGGAVVDGSIACTTCHDLAVQCLGNRDARYRNPAFVRGGPYKDTSEFCFLCHKSRDYKKLSPHRQVRGGRVQEQTCLFCHEEVPGKETGRRIAYRMGRDLARQCTGCHPVAPHPSAMGIGIGADTNSWIHLVEPSEQVLARMRLTEQRTGASLPLDPTTGKIFCATCHNPHDDELPGYPAASPAGEGHKLRIPELCGACHDK